MSSTLLAGQVNTEYNNADEAEIELLNGYGVSALKSPKLFKRTVDFTSQGSGNVSEMQVVATKWLLSDLMNEKISANFFETSEAAHIHDYADVLAWCIHILGESPSARAMLKESSDRGWKISLEDLSGGAYCIDVEQKLLILDNSSLVPSALGRSSYFRNLTVVTLIKALRDIWQEKRHGGFDEDYKPDYIMTLERIRAADCDVMSILVGWELRNADHTEIWRHLIGSENGDMAMCFSGHLEREPAANYNGRALYAAFKQWYRSHDRVTMCDHATLDYLDEVLATTSMQNPFGKKKPTKMNIELLSCLPDKTAYLQGLGQEIMHDPLYCGMDDDINQTHLFHILYDLEAVTVQDVPFRSRDLAYKIFPNGMLSE